MLFFFRILMKHRFSSIIWKELIHGSKILLNCENLKKQNLSIFFAPQLEKLSNTSNTLILPSNTLIAIRKLRVSTHNQKVLWKFTLKLKSSATVVNVLAHADSCFNFFQKNPQEFHRLQILLTPIIFLQKH